MNPIESADGLALHAAFERQRAAFAAEPYPAWSVRRDRLRRLRALILENERALAEAIDADFGGRPDVETQLAEIFPALLELNTALREGSRWMKRRRTGVDRWFLPARAWVLPQPLGVAGIIAPWNYPLLLAAAPLTAALAAGNRALVKLSEFTPRFGELFASLCAQRFDAAEVDIVLGDAAVGAAFAALPFDHLVFTGSTAVGRKVMQAAAANLTPVTLELGGKSPAIVTPGYPMQHAAERILAGKLLNAGQTCIAPDYVLVARADVDAFTAAARGVAARMFPRGLEDPHYTSIVNARQYERLAGWLEAALAVGTRAVPLFEGSPRDDARHRLAPQLLVDPRDDLALMRDEIFGPLLPIVPYDGVDAAIAYVAARPRPLALYWFDRDETRTERALVATHAGGVTVNDTLLHVAQHTLPFGGVGPSGIGHYHGRWGFDTLSKLKPVFRQSRLNAIGLFGPPYRPLAKRLIELAKRL